MNTLETATTRRRYWPLWVRIVFFSVLLVLLLQLAGFGVIRATIDSNARRALVADLDVGARIWQQLLEQRAERLRQAAGVLASDFGFRDAVASGDQETLVSALENHAGRINARVAAVFDTQLQPVAALLPEGVQQSDALHAMATQLAGSGWGVELVQGRPYQLVMVPMRAPLTTGWVLMGFPLDQAVLSQLHGITGLHATLLTRGANGTERALYATLPGALQLQRETDGVPAGEAVIDGETLLWQRLPLTRNAQQALKLELAGSLARALAPFQALQLWLLAITVAAVGLFTLLSYGMARFVTRPLVALMGAAESLGQGHYDTPLAHTDRGDEFGQLGTAFERMRQRIRSEMLFDQRLTGLPNRLQLRQVLAARLAQGQPASVLLLGLNRFKHVNRVLGYEAGDRLLQALGGRLQQLVRPGDFVARMGGDTFAWLLPDDSTEDALRAAARVGSALEQPLDLDDKQVDLHVAVGIACAPRQAGDADRLLAQAEVAMYTAKERKEAVLLYEPGFDTGSLQTLSLLSELRHARDNGELRLHLQPQVSLSEGRITGAEALLRWEHPRRGMVPPGMFIPYAEDTPIIRDLTLWVFEAVVKEQAALRAQGVQRISINLSARDLMDLDLPAKLEALLQRHGGWAEGLCLETTESAVMGDIDRARQTLARLAQRGYLLSIDDFGTGHSSMEYLKNLQVHELKIDMSFIQGMQHDTRDVSIVKAMIDVGHALGLTVVAEGVENETLARLLERMGCDEAQGWHYSKPLPAGALRAWAQTYQARLQAAAATPAAAETDRITRPAPLH